jgi:hypothetical protein
VQAFPATPSITPSDTQCCSKSPPPQRHNFSSTSYLAIKPEYHTKRCTQYCSKSYSHHNSQCDGPVMSPDAKCSPAHVPSGLPSDVPSQVPSVAPKCGSKCFPQWSTQYFPSGYPVISEWYAEHLLSESSVMSQARLPVFTPTAIKENAAYRQTWDSHRHSYARPSGSSIACHQYVPRRQLHRRTSYATEYVAGHISIAM